MRTTLDLADEAWHVARAVARERNTSLGKVVSDFILLKASATQPPGQARSTAGFPLFASGKVRTSEDVRALLDEE